MKINAGDYVDVFDNTGLKIFTVMLESDYYKLGVLSKTKPNEYTISILNNEQI